MSYFKGKVETFFRWGIYEIKCNGCHLKHYRQTRRAIKTRFKKPLGHLKYGITENIVTSIRK